MLKDLLPKKLFIKHCLGPASLGLVGNRLKLSAYRMGCRWWPWRVNVKRHLRRWPQMGIKPKYRFHLAMSHLMRWHLLLSTRCHWKWIPEYEKTKARREIWIYKNHYHCRCFASLKTNQLLLSSALSDYLETGFRLSMVFCVLMMSPFTEIARDLPQLATAIIWSSLRCI